MAGPIQILILEDRDADFKLIVHELRKSGADIVCRRGASYDEYIAQLSQHPLPDIILSDYSMLQFDAGRALRVLQERALDIPFIVISGTIGEELAVAMMKQGAADYLLKDRLGRLPLAVEQALDRQRLRQERQAVLEQLRESERRFSAFMNHLPGAAFIKDGAGRHVYVNATWERMFGKDRDAWWGRTNEQLFPPATAFQMSHHDRLVRDSDTPLQTIETIEQPDHLDHYLVVKFPIEAGDGGLVAGMGIEITDRIRAEESLREQIRLARISADVGQAMTRNQPLAEMLRASADSLLRNLGAVAVRIWTLQPPAPTLELLASAGLTPQPDEYRIAPGHNGISTVAQTCQPILTNDILQEPRVRDLGWMRHESLVALAALPLLINDRPVGVLGVYARKPFSEATHAALRLVANQIAVGIERKQSEDALRGSEERYRRIVETTAEGILVLDADGRTTFANANMAKMMGLAVTAMTEQPLLALLHEQDRPRAETLLQRLSLGREEQFDFKIQRRDDKELWLMIAAAPIFSADGRYSGALLMCSDITERKRLEDQYRQAQKMEAVGRLAGGVAHDFNNLITIINVCSDLVLAELPGTHAGRGYVEDIKKAGERGAALTRQLLAFSRRQLLEPHVVDLNNIVSEVDKLLRRTLGEDIEICNVLEPELGHVKVDPGQVQQILMNLAVNARDAMPRGGQLIIETRNVMLDDAYARFHPEIRPGDYVMLAVSDTGVGMDAAIQNRVFEPFFTTKEPGKGTGLGLATVYGIVKQSGGHINLYSEPGHGTSFKIYFPRVEEPLSDPETQAGPPKRLHGSETVLLVEDEATVRLLSRHILELYGYHVLEASHPDEAIALAQQHAGPIELLLTDVVMPGGGGRQVAERLSVIKPGIKVLYVSGYTDDAVVRYGILRAEAAFLQKPFSAKGLAEKVREVLSAAP